jgi:tRNA G26 N,N-dimethylase Trm1
LRTIRYLKELKGVECVYANDLLPAAHKLMQDNFDLNELDPSKYKLTLKDANVLMR